MRRNRILVKDGTYHVFTKVNRKEMLFELQEERHHFLEVLERAKKKYSFDLYDFCVIDESVYLIIRPKNGCNLSRIMQWINSVYAMGWNRRHGMTGHVWGERFYSRVLPAIIEMVRVIRFTSNRPVLAGKVKKASDWKDGGLHHILNGDLRVIAPHPVWLKMFLPEFQPLMLCALSAV